MRNCYLDIWLNSVSKLFIIFRCSRTMNIQIKWTIFCVSLGIRTQTWRFTVSYAHRLQQWHHIDGMWGNAPHFLSSKPNVITFIRHPNISRRAAWPLNDDPSPYVLNVSTLVLPSGPSPPTFILKGWWLDILRPQEHAQVSPYYHLGFLWAHFRTQGQNCYVGVAGSAPANTRFQIVPI